jgi:hypothetical protein
MFDNTINSKMSYIQLSIDFLNSVKGLPKSCSECEEYVEALKSAHPDELQSELNTEVKQLVFWLNTYNANVQLILRQYPEMYDKRRSFFSSPKIWIAGEKLSLDLIEHGILRKSKYKYSLGYLNKFFPSAFERKFRLNKPDYRIHFALNCGAKSCPMIVSYDFKNINEQLDASASHYLLNEVYHDTNLNHAEIPALFLWFRKDFGGANGIRAILKKYSIIPNDLDPILKYKKYDWSLYLDNFN